MTTPVPPKVSKSRHISPIWILPFIALLIAIWLVYRSISEAGIMVEIIFQDAQGLEAGKTQVIYRGLPIGVVQELKIQPDFHSVVALVEFDRMVEDQLRENSQFWMVKAELSASGIRGLDTIIKGNYIAMRPSNGQPQLRFTALLKQPLENADKIGLYLKLISDDPGSVGQGNKVYYRHIEAGEVQDVYLNEQDQVVTRIRIKPSFVNKVKTSSRFYQLSGVTLEGGLDGISLKTVPLAAMISGGISFVSPDLSAPQVHLDHEFTLYPSEKKAAKSTVTVKKKGLYLSLLADEAGSLKEGSKIHYKKIPVGEIVSLGLTENDKIKCDLFIEPEFANKINQSSLFYELESFNVEAGLDGFSMKAASLSTIVNGGIAFTTPNKKAPRIKAKTIFNLYNSKADALGKSKESTKTHFFTLLGNEAGSLKIGSKIFFKGLEAGKIKALSLLENDQMKIEIELLEKFSKRVNQSTLFYLQDGISFEGGLDGIKFNTGSLATLLRSGISFNTPQKKARKTNKYYQFKLYADKGEAELANQAQQAGLYIHLETDDPGSISQGSKIYFKHIAVGEVIKLAFTKKNQVRISIRIQSKHRRKLKNNARFYKAGGISLKGGLRGFKIQTESLSSIVKGGLAFVLPTKNAGIAHKGQVFKLYESQEEAEKSGVLVRLHAPNAEDLNIGSKIKYLGLNIGSISQVKMRSSAKEIVFEASIENQYSHLIKSSSQFWVVKPEVTLTGVKNLSSIVSGTFVQILPGDGSFRRDFDILSKAPLAVAKQHHQNDVLEVVLATSRLGTIHVDAPVMFRDVKVGSVVSVGLADDATKVNIKIAIKPEYSKLVRTDSKFWRSSGITLDGGLFSGVSLKFGGFESLIQGGISFATPGRGQQEITKQKNNNDDFEDDDAPLFERVRNSFIKQPPASAPATQGMHFDLVADPEEEWLAWKAEIK